MPPKRDAANQIGNGRHRRGGDEEDGDGQRGDCDSPAVVSAETLYDEAASIKLNPRVDWCAQKSFELQYFPFAFGYKNQTVDTEYRIYQNRESNWLVVLVCLAGIVAAIYCVAQPLTLFTGFRYVIGIDLAMEVLFGLCLVYVLGCRRGAIYEGLSEQLWTSKAVEYLSMGIFMGISLTAAATDAQTYFLCQNGHFAKSYYSDVSDRDEGLLCRFELTTVFGCTATSYALLRKPTFRLAVWGLLLGIVAQGAFLLAGQKNVTVSVPADYPVELAVYRFLGNLYISVTVILVRYVQEVLYRRSFQSLYMSVGRLRQLAERKRASEEAASRIVAPELRQRLMGAQKSIDTALKATFVFAELANIDALFPTHIPKSRVRVVAPGDECLAEADDVARIAISPAQGLAVVVQIEEHLSLLAPYYRVLRVAVSGDVYCGVTHLLSSSSFIDATTSTSPLSLSHTSGRQGAADSAVDALLFGAAAIQAIERADLHGARLRVGVHTGVTIGAPAGGIHLHYAVFGESAKGAEALCAVGETSQLVTSTTTLEMCAGVVEIRYKELDKAVAVPKMPITRAAAASASIREDGPLPSPDETHMCVSVLVIGQHILNVDHCDDPDVLSTNHPPSQRPSQVLLPKITIRKPRRRQRRTSSINGDLSSGGDGDSSGDIALGPPASRPPIVSPADPAIAKLFGSRKPKASQNQRSLTDDEGDAKHGTGDEIPPVMPPPPSGDPSTVTPTSFVIVPSSSPLRRKGPFGDPNAMLPDLPGAAVLPPPMATTTATAAPLTTSINIDVLMGGGDVATKEAQPEEGEESTPPVLSTRTSLSSNASEKEIVGMLDANLISVNNSPQLAEGRSEHQQLSPLFSPDQDGNDGDGTPTNTSIFFAAQEPMQFLIAAPITDTLSLVALSLDRQSWPSRCKLDTCCCASISRLPLEVFTYGFKEGLFQISNATDNAPVLFLICVIDIIKNLVSIGVRSSRELQNSNTVIITGIVSAAIGSLAVIITVVKSWRHLLGFIGLYAPGDESARLERLTTAYNQLRMAGMASNAKEGPSASDTDDMTTSLREAAAAASQDDHEDAPESSLEGVQYVRRLHALRHASIVIMAMFFTVHIVFAMASVSIISLPIELFAVGVYLPHTSLPSRVMVFVYPVVVVLAIGAYVFYAGILRASTLYLGVALGTLYCLVAEYKERYARNAFRRACVSEGVGALLVREEAARTAVVRATVPGPLYTWFVREYERTKQRPTTRGTSNPNTSSNSTTEHSRPGASLGSVVGAGMSTSNPAVPRPLVTGIVHSMHPRCIVIALRLDTVYDTLIGALRLGAASAPSSSNNASRKSISRESHSTPSQTSNPTVSDPSTAIHRQISVARISSLLLACMRDVEAALSDAEETVQTLRAVLEGSPSVASSRPLSNGTRTASSTKGLIEDPSCTLSVSNVMGDMVTIVGPLSPKPLEGDDAADQLPRTLTLHAAIQFLVSLSRRGGGVGLSKRARYAACVTHGALASAITRSDYPRCQVYGAPVYVARALQQRTQRGSFVVTAAVAAPMEAILASRPAYLQQQQQVGSSPSPHRVENPLSIPQLTPSTSLRPANEGPPIAEFSPAKVWSLPHVGRVRVRHLHVLLPSAGTHVEQPASPKVPSPFVVAVPADDSHDRPPHTIHTK